MQNIMARYKAKRASKGFTLIELMIVVAIIAIIAAIIAINYQHAKNNAQVAASEANLKQIATAAELYYADNQSYPATGAVAPALFGVSYLNTTPKPPGGASGTTYTFTNTSGVYVITDPTTYDAASLASVPKASDGSACAAACTKIEYTSTGGLAGL